MRFSKQAAAGIIAISSSSIVSSFAPRLALQPRSKIAASSIINRSIASYTSPLQMGLLDSLFGGGAIGSKIDYTTLDPPGEELANAAQEGKALVNGVREPNLELATFAGGCFWGFELAYQRVPGVEYTAVGYTQGPETEPTYSQVCSGTTGHTEAVIVYYDPKQCTYENLLDVFFNRVNPTQVNGQGNDRGTQYRTGVYFHTAKQEEAAKARFQLEQGNYNKPIASELKQSVGFWPAEKYHQQYLEKGGQNASKGSTDTIRCYG